MPSNTCKVRAVAIEQGRPTNTNKEMKNACKHPCYDAARNKAATRTTRSHMHNHEEVQLCGHQGEIKTHEGEMSKMRNGTHAKHNTNHKQINALAPGRGQNQRVQTRGKDMSNKG